MLGTRKRSLSLPTKRRCCACQQKHIKCEYEKDDEKCKACRANDRACIVKHRFQHVNPASKRSRKRADSARSKKSIRSVEETLTGNMTNFSLVEWISQEPPPTSSHVESAVTGVSEEGDDDGGGGGDIQQIQEDISGAPRDIVRPADMNGDNDDPPRSHLFENPIAPKHLERDNSQNISPSITFLTPAFDQFSSSSHLSGPLFSPTGFPAPAMQHVSPLPIETSSTSPEGSRLEEREKAFLLRHFTDVLWKWFDICDPEQHFRRVVPVRALKCPTLMKAICASSAWHLCRKGKYDRERSNSLYENCLHHLIKAMDNPDVGSDDSILIAATIMHNVEELRDLEHTLMLESRGHLVGINNFFNAQGLYWERNSLRQAAFRVAMREELHTCFINQQPLTLPRDICGIDQGFTPADDETWAWRVYLIYRDALANSLSPVSVGEWERICNDLQSWYNLKPDSFEPTFFQDASPCEGRYLPEIWLLHDSHIMGTIHYHFCRIVLATSNPRVPKIGWNRAAALKKVDDEVRSSVLTVAGIAMSNQLLPSAMTSGATVITMCAEVVTDSALQSALFEVFVKAKDIHGWPTEASQAYVRSVWYGEGETGKTIGYEAVR